MARFAPYSRRPSKPAAPAHVPPSIALMADQFRAKPWVGLSSGEALLPPPDPTPQVVTRTFTIPPPPWIGQAPPVGLPAEPEPVDPGDLHRRALAELIARDEGYAPPPPGPADRSWTPYVPPKLPEVDWVEEQQKTRTPNLDAVKAWKRAS